MTENTGNLQDYGTVGRRSKRIERLLRRLFSSVSGNLRAAMSLGIWSLQTLWFVQVSPVVKSAMARLILSYNKHWKHRCWYQSRSPLPGEPLENPIFCQLGGTRRRRSPRQVDAHTHRCRPCRLPFAIRCSIHLARVNKGATVSQHLFYRVSF